MHGRSIEDLLKHYAAGIQLERPSVVVDDDGLFVEQQSQPSLTDDDETNNNQLDSNNNDDDDNEDGIMAERRFVHGRDLISGDDNDDYE